jgi:hypothetical protein
VDGVEGKRFEQIKTRTLALQEREVKMVRR